MVLKQCVRRCRGDHHNVLSTLTGSHLRHWNGADRILRSADQSYIVPGSLINTVYARSEEDTVIGDRSVSGDVMKSDEAHLRAQIRQLREAVAAIENQNQGHASMHPEELWTLLETRWEEKEEPMHPRLVQLLKGHVDVNSVKRGLKRLENDLEDLEHDLTELHEPPKHDMEREDATSGFDAAFDNSADTEVDTEDNDHRRDECQQSLWAYNAGEDTTEGDAEIVESADEADLQQEGDDDR